MHFGILFSYIDLPVQHYTTEYRTDRQKSNKFMFKFLQVSASWQIGRVLYLHKRYPSPFWEKLFFLFIKSLFYTGIPPPSEK